MSRLLRQVGGILPAIVLLQLVVASCSNLAPVEPTQTPMALPSDTPLPTATTAPTAIATPTFTPSPMPTLDPDVIRTTVSDGQAGWVSRGVRPLCLQWHDTDGDGEPEWVGVYHQTGEKPQLRAFVLDGGAWHDLFPLEKAKYGLGQYATCELEVRDATGDGRVEILVWGYAETNTTLLHIFVWDGSGYTLVAPFEGPVGVRMEDRDGDLIDEVVLRYRMEGDLVWEPVYTWDGWNYGWSWERYGWFYPGRPHVYRTDTPERAVIAFYLALGDRDLPAAFGLLSGPAQANQSYEAWVAGYATTVAVEAGAVSQIESGEGSATVACHVRAYDNIDGRVVSTLWDVKWTLVGSEAGWRLSSAAGTVLERREVAYYQ